MIARKRRTREHIIADLSVNFVERQILLCGHTVERIRADYGYDLLLFTYDANGEREHGELYLQVKATDALLTGKGGGTISWRLLRSDLATWLHSSVPVILIVYDAKDDRAYWLYVQRYFQALPGFDLFSAGKTITAHVPTGHLLGPPAVTEFAGFRDAVSRQTQGVIDHNA